MASHSTFFRLALNTFCKALAVRNGRVLGILPAFFILSCSAPSKNTTATGQASPRQEAKVVFPQQQVSTPAGINYIYDYEDVFSAKEEQRLDSLVRNFEKSNLIAIKVAAVTDPAITAENFDQANQAMLEEWAAVHGKSDKCMAISISKKLRRIRIDYGPFVARLLSDDATAQIIETEFKPGFKAEAYYDGTRNGLTALMNTIRQNIKF
ncbi:TPM domain-containing protein [Niabella insulamsoli]|uniref:TPM domain-containing protein n=1 Tax=Niabella insulamsoli TaxID=3144874 RepID=UPI0031FC8E98